MFFIGVPLTVIGFFIAYTVASKTQKKPEELTEVQKSIEELNINRRTKQRTINTL